MKAILSGEWRGRPDPDAAGEASQWYLPANSNSGGAWETTNVPSCWNCTPGYERYEGMFWYSTDFDLPANSPEQETETVLRFLAVNYACRVWVNGHEIGSHEGGYLPFEFTVPADVLTWSNRLVVRVDNIRSSKRIPGVVFDWYNYGGIVRDVQLICRSPKHFRHVQVRTALPENGVSSVTVGYAQTEPFAFRWIVESEGRTMAEGILDSATLAAEFSIEINEAKIWSPDTPNLYVLRLIPIPENAATGREVTFGIREIRVSGMRIYLNGVPIKFCGVSLHEELLPYGRAIPAEERFQDVKDIKALGFNAIRTAHYTHDEALIEAADRIGLLVFEEIPVYWEIDYSDPAVFDLAERMLRDMVDRDVNHPSVVLWSVGNEVPVDRPDCDHFIRRSMDIVRALDPTRIVTYVSCRYLIDKTRRASDACCLNSYVGWYYGQDEDLASYLLSARTTAPDKPWIITEFGACAQHGFSDSLSKAKYSEVRQEEFLIHYIRTINSMDWISGWFIWIYRDFRSPLRTHPRQQGFNRKGIVSEKREPKKICAHFPELLEEKLERTPGSPAPLFAAALSSLERLAYRTAMPWLGRGQRRALDSFYKNKPE
jgi:beta-glucuronidase